MDTHDLVIRPFDVADTEALSDIWFDASLKAHGFLGQARLAEQRALIEDQYLPDAETWVACHGTERVGFVGLIDTFIGGIFIAPAWQGRGVGRKLIAHALQQKRELSLEVYTRNEQAFGFYTALGFVEQSRRDVDDLGLPFENAILHLKC